MRTHPEALLISAALRTDGFNLAMRLGASSRLFHVHHEEWRWIEKEWERSKKTPSKLSFKHQFPAFKLKATDDVETAVDQVKKSHAHFETQVFFEEAVKLMESGKSDEAVRLIAARSGEVVYEIEHTADAVDMIEDWEDTYDDVVARIERVKASGWAGVPTGIPSLDKITGGLQGSWLTIVAARLGVGKTWSGISMAHGAISAGYDALFFSLEQSRHQVAMRMQGLAAAALGYELNPARLTQGVGVDPKLYRQILEEISEEMSGKFLVNDASRGRVSVATLEAAVESKKPAILFIDYIGLLKSKTTEWQDMAQLSGDLKVLAAQYDIPVVALSQLNRGGVGKDPGAENLARSDSVGQDADLILTLTNQTEHVKRMKLIKNRHGPDGSAWFMHFDPAKGIYAEISGNKAADIMDDDLDSDD